MGRRGALRALALLLLAEAPGCGYALVGSANSLPPDVRAIAVPVFRNTTQRAGVEQRLSEAVAREISGRGGLTVPGDPENADAILEGTVTSYVAWPSNLDSSGRANEYQITVNASVRLVSKKGETILAIPGFQFQETWTVVGPASDTTDFSDRENAAIEALADEFASSLVSAILEGF